MARRKQQPDIQEQIDELKDTVGEIRDATVTEDGKKSLPAGRLQRGVEDLARLAGVKDAAKTWSATKDVGRAFVPTQVEALARAKLRGEDYEDAKAKAEESREDLENSRPGLFATGQATQSTVGLLAGIALYAKLAGGGRAPQPAATPTPAVPVKPATKADLVAEYTRRFGQAPTSATMRTKTLLQQAIDSKQPAPSGALRAPMIRGAGKLALVATAGAMVGAYLSSSARQQSATATSTPTAAPGSYRGAQEHAPVTTYERTYTSGPKAGQTETVTRKR